MVLIYSYGFSHSVPIRPISVQNFNMQYYQNKLWEWKFYLWSFLIFVTPKSAVTSWSKSMMKVFDLAEFSVKKKMRK